MFNLKVQSSVSLARRGEVVVTHGSMQSPFFMPIATKGAVRALSVDDVRGVGAQIVLSNTYHLLLRPGLDRLRRFGGLHAFMKWSGPMLTDSGGYQVFSLGKLRKVTEESVVFQSHIDGSRVELTPELSVGMQQAIGSDIMMQLDVVLPPSSSRQAIEGAVDQSLRWAFRCKEYLNSHREDSLTRDQKLFGIVQGGVDEKLRQKSLDGLIELDLDGYAVGGLSVGESREDNLRVAEYVAERLPDDKPRYFMGGGKPEEIVAYVQMGIDMFDCVIPTRHARHGSLFVWNDEPGAEMLVGGDFYSTFNIMNARFAEDEGALDEHCDCELCTRYSRAYLRHLFDMHEVLGIRLATEHNLRFYMRLMRELRDGIEDGTI